MSASRRTRKTKKHEPTPTGASSHSLLSAEALEAVRSNGLREALPSGGSTKGGASNACVEGLVRAAEVLRDTVARIKISLPVTHVYNPLDYAWTAHRQYIEKYGGSTGRTVLLGMNPGPFGMAQTGVPFGEVNLVRDWLGIAAEVGRPPNEHPARPVLGFDCPRSEVSGARLWGWAKQRFKTPQAFFSCFYVVNYCPLVFMEASGKNRTPDRLPVDERVALFEACDSALRATVECLQPTLLIGVGGFAHKRALQALAEGDVPIGQMLHPSPANPKANADWAGTIEAQLTKLGVL